MAFRNGYQKYFTAGLPTLLLEKETDWRSLTEEIRDSPKVNPKFVVKASSESNSKHIFFLNHLMYK